MFKIKNIEGFSDVKKQAGYYWLEGFMKRNKGLSLQKPESLSAARAAGMNPQTVENWFREYEKLLSDLDLTDRPSHLWNCDESGLQDNFQSLKVLCEIGKPCFEVTAGEKGETTTVLAGFNATGTFTPVMVIFKSKRVRMEWMSGCPELAIVRTSDNGWINAQLFLEWGQRFVASLPKEDNTPHVLLLDGHSSHVYSLEFLYLMKAHNVHVMSYPSHTTHALQPADKSLFKSLKHNWTEAGRRWTRKTGGMKLPKPFFFSLFAEAWAKTATMENAQAGFRGTGMFPVNKDIIPPEIYAPSHTTERPLPELELELEQNHAVPEVGALVEIQLEGNEITESTLFMEEGIDFVEENVVLSGPQVDDEQPSTSAMVGR